MGELTKEQRAELTVRSLQTVADILYSRGVLPTRSKQSVAYHEKRAMRKLRAALRDLESELDGR
jgi:hypothetical protein